MRKIFPTMIKVLIVVALLAGGLTIWQVCSGGPSCVERINKTVPDTSTAPYIVLTRTHFYYAQKAYENDDHSVTMMRWYEKFDDKWVFHGESFTIPTILQPKITNR